MLIEYSLDMSNKVCSNSF